LVAWRASLTTRCGCGHLQCAGADIKPDERSYHLALLRTLGVSDSICLLYPRLYQLNVMPAECGTVDEGGKVPTHHLCQQPINQSTNPPTHHHRVLVFPVPHRSPRRLCCVSRAPCSQVVLPPVNNLSSEKLDQSGIFLLDDGQYLLLWVGKLAAPEAVHALFGVPSLFGVDDALLKLVDQGTSGIRPSSSVPKQQQQLTRGGGGHAAGGDKKKL
jgi:hypothetical protein